jgi:hypothetical protein
MKLQAATRARLVRIWVVTELAASRWVGEQGQLAHKNTGIALRQIDGGRVEIGPLVESLQQGTGGHQRRRSSIGSEPHCVWSSRRSNMHMRTRKRTLQRRPAPTKPNNIRCRTSLDCG